MAGLSAAEVSIDYSQIKEDLLVSPTTQDLYKGIVNKPFDYQVATAFMFLGIIVLLFLNEETGNIDRVALSNTELAQNTTEVSLVPFHQIKIPASHPENIIATAIRTGEFQDTIDWKFLFEPSLSPEQARLNQASGGIAYSAVRPLLFGKGKGAMIFSYYQYMHDIGHIQHTFMKQYADLVVDVLNYRYE